MVTRIIERFSKIWDCYDTYLVDQWGVLHNGYKAYHSAVEVMWKLREKGKSLVILSNSSRREHTTRHNMKSISIDDNLFERVVTSGEEVWQALHKRSEPFYTGLGTRCVVFQWGQDNDFFEGLDLEVVRNVEDAEFILLNGTEKDKNSEYEEVLREGVERSLPLVCSNGDFVSMTPDGKLVNCPGKVARRYESLGGRVKWHGKPTLGAYRMALEGVASDARVLAIGDSLYHDIGGANAAGVDSLFISSGIHRLEINKGTDHLLNLEILHRLYVQYGGTPTYVLRQLIW